MDRLAQAPGAVQKRGVGDVFGAELGKSEFLNAVIDLNDQSHTELLAEFLAGFGNLIDQAKTELTAWASVAEDGSSGLKSAVWRAHQDYRHEVESLRSEERRVGKECSNEWAPYPEKSISEVHKCERDILS